MAQSTGRVPIPTVQRRFGGISQVGQSSYSNAPTMRFGQENMQVGGPRTAFRGGLLRSAASRDPIAGLASSRRSIDAAGRRFWGRGGPPPSNRTPSLSEKAYGNRTRGGVLSTGFGSTRPKLLSMRRFTSRWLSPSSPGRPAFGGLTQNPLYAGGGGEEFGRGPGFGGTYSGGQRTGRPGYRPTV